MVVVVVDLGGILTRVLNDGTSFLRGSGGVIFNPPHSPLIELRVVCECGLLTLVNKA